MTLPVEVKNLFVSSENRDTAIYPSGNTYVVELNTPIKDIRRIELLYASVPNTIYNVSDGTGVITIGLNTFSIPEGFYSGSGLATELTNAINTLSGVTVSYLHNEGKFLFTKSSSFNLVVNNAEMRNLLGISTTDSITSDTVPSTGTGNIELYSYNSRYDGKYFVKSSTIADLQPDQGIFLDIDELRSIYNEDASRDGQSMRRTFGIIPMDVNGGQIKNFKKTTDYDMVVDYTNPIRKLDRLTVRWVNRLGLPVNFNGKNDNSFLLRLHTLRTNLKNKM